MEAYTDFAAVYDTFMDETPYDVWGNFVAGLIEKYGISEPVKKDEGVKSGAGKEAHEAESAAEENSEEALLEEKNLVVELGCGTGAFTRVMRGLGYDICGIDISPEMLNIARSRNEESGLDIMYLEQDMRELDLYCTAGTIISVCDSINYILEDKEMIDTFKLVNNFLFPKGIFIFDFNTIYKYAVVIGDATIAESRDDCSFIWDNYYHEESHINEYDLTIFARASESEDLFTRSVETHFQRGYTLSEMKKFVDLAGMEFVAAFDADTWKDPSEISERIYIVARENSK
ncbi:MAG: methyltransferase domain-containing protein [Butyrivibrio sp.]|nr:methyltransferase domain-containing protein [Butyrivibrio sp.]